MLGHMGRGGVGRSDSGARAYGGMERSDGGARAYESGGEVRRWC